MNLKKAAATTSLVCCAGMVSIMPGISEKAYASELVHNDFEVNYDGWYSNGDTVKLTTVNGDGFEKSAWKIAADVDQSDVFDVTDVKLLQEFIANVITEFPVEEKPEEPVEPDEPNAPVADVDPTVYMDNVREILSEYALSGGIEEYSWVEYGTMTKYQYYSTTRERMTNVNVLLPPGYNTNETYPVLYALHGYWETEGADHVWHYVTTGGHDA